MVVSRHAEWGEEGVECVVGRAPLVDAAARDALVRALDALCRSSLARFKRPREYRVLAELPKNTAGKVLKTALRDVVDARGDR